MGRTASHSGKQADAFAERARQIEDALIDIEWSSCRFGDRRSILLLDWLAGFFPAAKTRGEIVEFLEAHRLQLFAGFGAPHAARAMDQVGFAFVQVADFLVKISRV